MNRVRKIVVSFLVIALPDFVWAIPFKANAAKTAAKK